MVHPTQSTMVMTTPLFLRGKVTGHSLFLTTHYSYRQEPRASELRQRRHGSELTSHFNCCVVSGKLHPLSEPPCPQLEHGSGQMALRIPVTKGVHCDEGSLETSA